MFGALSNKYPFHIKHGMYIVHRVWLNVRDGYSHLEEHMAGLLWEQLGWKWHTMKLHLCLQCKYFTVMNMSLSATTNLDGGLQGLLSTRLCLIHLKLCCLASQWVDTANTAQTTTNWGFQCEASPAKCHSCHLPLLQLQKVLQHIYTVAPVPHAHCSYAAYDYLIKLVGKYTLFVLVSRQIGTYLWARVA